MLKNYFIIAWRNLWRNKLYSVINLAGLSVGMSCCVIIYLYIHQELSYDTWNEKSDRIYRITSDCHLSNGDRYFAITPPVLFPEAAKNFPEIESGVRLAYSGGDRALSFGEKKLYDTRVYFADSSIFDVFTLPLVKGSSGHLLDEPYSVVLSETTAKNYFGDKEAVGQTMKMSDSVNLKVTGVIKDLPLNSHIQFDALVSRATLMSMFAGNAEMISEVHNWLNFDSHTYVLLRENVNREAFAHQLNAFIASAMAEKSKRTGITITVALQPLKDIHLYSHLENELEPYTNSDSSYVYIFSATALLILLVACCNFINLSTARSQNRAKEIGLRKVVGGSRTQLIGQFLGESVLFSFLAGLVSFLVVLSTISLFNPYLSIPLQLEPDLIVVYTVIIVFTGIVAGLYPAFLLSSFRPVVSLKGKIRHGWIDIFFRKGLVIFQFSVAIVLIVFSTLIFRQLDFIQNRKIGMNREQLMQMKLRFADVDKAPLILEELRRQPDVVNATLNNFSFVEMPVMAMIPEGAQKNKMDAQNIISVDENFLQTFGLGLAAGRNFSKELKTDSGGAFIVNEAAVRTFGWVSPQRAIGKKIDAFSLGKGPVIGVVKDFNYASLHGAIRPLVMHVSPGEHIYITLRLRPEHMSKTIENAEVTWKRFAADSPFNYTFLEEQFNALYKNEMKMRSVVGIFTCLALFVACLGLFGLSAFTIRQRIKEIGIRKVLGASVQNIGLLLSKDFLKLVLVAIFIALPLSWLISNRWLQDFAYKTNLSWWIFAIAGALALLVAFFTVVFHALRAANVNPVKNLRTE